MTLEVKDIQGIIPHRYPFLFVDRVLELEPGQRAVGLKNVTTNEWFFEGHFPGYPLMPGVIMVEALAQLAAVALWSLPENKGKQGLFAGIENFRFRKPVQPGDALRLEVKLVRSRRVFFTFSAVASVGDKPVAEGELTLAIAPGGIPQ